MKRFSRLTVILLIVIMFSYTITRAQTSGSNSTYLPLIAKSSIRVLWTDDCDPRTDPLVCHISDSLTILNEFYAALNDAGATIQYAMPQSLDQLGQFDVVIANYCSSLYRNNLSALLGEYVTQGGSVIVLGDNFCIVGSDSQGNVSSARAANALTTSRGITFTSDDVSDTQFANQISVHPTTANVGTIYSYRHAYLQIGSLATPIVMMASRPFIAVYEGTGKLIAIPNIGFYWGNSFQRVGESDNFVFWRNALRWMALRAH